MSSFDYFVGYNKRPKGEIILSGSKHVALRCLAASLLTSEKIEIQNFPNGLLDVEKCIALLEVLGKSIVQYQDKIVISGKPSNLSNKLYSIRESVRITSLMLGPLLAWQPNVMVPIPGGCKIGSRPINLHKIVLELLGARVNINDDYISAFRYKNKLKGARIFLPIKSNGAGECAILAGCLAEGTTVIENAHITPELHDFVSFLNSMGAKIKVNSSNVTVNGIEKLFGTKYRIMNDIVEGITYIILATLTGGYVEIYGLPIEDSAPVLQKLEYIGVNLSIRDKTLVVKPPKRELEGFKITSGPYPQIYSDMGPLFTVLGLKCNGISFIKDDRWPYRFTHVAPLNEMGANIIHQFGYIVIHGKKRLNGTIVKANDIRCGMSLLLASLISSGFSIIRYADQIERGYENVIKKLKIIGIEIKKISFDSKINYLPIQIIETDRKKLEDFQAPPV